MHALRTVTVSWLSSGLRSGSAGTTAHLGTVTVSWLSSGLHSGSAGTTAHLRTVTVSWLSSGHHSGSAGTTAHLRTPAFLSLHLFADIDTATLSVYKTQLKALMEQF
jgi:hypothetical protein